mgnify:CR=1 FL=1
MDTAHGTLRRDSWYVATDVDDRVAYDVLALDRVWNCFAIADLAPPYRAYSSYAIARRGDPAPSAVCLVLRHPAFTMLIPSGDAAGVAAMLAELELPAQTEFQVRAEHLTALECHYHVLPGAREMLRMGVTPSSVRSPGDISAAAVARLGPADLPAMLDLYRRYPESHFRPEHLQHGVFFGVRADGRLLAAGGTHVVAKRYGLGVLGSIFTRPEARRQGHGRAVTAAIIEELFARGCRDAMLTVVADNHAAIQLYASLGFGAHCRYWSGSAALRRERLEGRSHDGA